MPPAQHLPEYPQPAVDPAQRLPEHPQVAVAPVSPWPGLAPPPAWPAGYVAGEQLSIARWVGQGWQTFRARPLPWILWALAMLLPSAALEIYRYSQGWVGGSVSPGETGSVMTTTLLSLALTISLLPLHVGGNLYALSLQRGAHPPAMKFLQAYARGAWLVAALALMGLMAAPVFLLVLLPGRFLSATGALAQALVVVYMLIATPFAVGVYLYLLLGWMFAPVLVADREMNAMDAMRTSWHLVDGHRWRLLGLILVLVAIAFAGVLACLVGSLVTQGIVAGAFSAAYRDLAVRSGDMDSDTEL
ncbi:MAG: hypothetical protein HZB25_00760 [Candidatus Eisenbacteria bacterium]|nr:hypothetical protein [Candidatus Eisenbacteria bacterium]